MKIGKKIIKIIYARNKQLMTLLLICQKYEVPYDKAQYEIRANTGKKVFKIMMGN